MRKAPPPQSRHNLRWRRSCVRGFHSDEVAWTRIAQPFFCMINDLRMASLAKLAPSLVRLPSVHFKQFCLKFDLRYSNAFEGHGLFRVSYPEKYCFGKLWRGERNCTLSRYAFLIQALKNQIFNWKLLFLLISSCLSRTFHQKRKRLGDCCVL